VVSESDKKTLTSAQQAAIQEATNDYNAAKAAGDRAGMDKAHATAEAIRNSKGYSGGIDGSGYIVTAMVDKKSNTVTTTSTNSISPKSTPTVVYVPSSTSSGGYIQTPGYFQNGQTYLMDGSKINNGTIIEIGGSYSKLVNGKLVQTTKPTNLLIPAVDAAKAGLKMSTDNSSLIRSAGYYTINGVYGWYTKPDIWEFGETSDTYKILKDLNSKWLSMSHPGDRAQISGVAQEVRRMFRENTPAVFAQEKIESLLVYMDAEAKKINNDLNYSSLYDTGLEITAARLGTFMNLVKTGGKFDLKSKPEWQYKYSKYHGSAVTTEWEKNSAEYLYSYGRLWSIEQLGNYTFGYFGAAFGYGEEFLCFGAGVYQKFSPSSESVWGFFESYWDDPRDQENIRRGYRKYESTH